MLFYIDDTLIEELDNNNSIVVLEQLAASRRKGNHIVTGSRKILKTLSQHDSLSKPTQGIYRKLYNELATVANTLDKLATRVEISSGDIFKTSQQNDIQIIKVSIKYLINLDFNETTFLAENLSDIKFYETLAKVYIHKKRLGKIPIKCNRRGGGGQTTAQELESIISRKQELCLSILDSDRKSPYCGLGDTAKKAKIVHEKYTNLQSDRYCKYANYFCKLAILNVREIENLIPTFMYEQIREKSPERLNSVLSIQKLEQFSIIQAIKYIDIKKGTKLFGILNNKNQQFFEDFWSDICNAHKDMNTNCLKDMKCLKTEEIDCTCVLSHPFGDKVLENVIDIHLEKMSPKNICEEIDYELKDEWNRIGEIITAWCCGSSRISG